MFQLGAVIGDGSPDRSLPFKYLGMKSMGPGRYREMPAMMSSRLSGFSSFMKLFIPPLSSWNTPSVLACADGLQYLLYR